MFTRILNDDEVKLFNDLTGMNTKRVFISKNHKYYYATIVDTLAKIRISKAIAIKFM